MEVQSAGDNIVYLVLIGTMGGLLLACSLIFFYIRYQRKFTRQHIAMQQAELEHKQMLLHSIIQSQEEERLRISKDLHDHVGSALSGLRMHLSRIDHTEDYRMIKDIAGNSRAGIDSIIDDVRNISHSLSPAGLELWGFHEALEDYCDRIRRTSDLDVTISDETDNVLKSLQFDDALSLFRVIQELINNTIRHAGAQNIRIVVTRREGRILLLYSDDGIGIKKDNKPGIGVYNIESRLSMIRATYEIVSSEGKGYTMKISLPETLLSKAMC